MFLTLNIGCNVNNVPAFTPAFALAVVAQKFSVVDSDHFTLSYQAEVDGVIKDITETTLVVTVADEGRWTNELTFSVSAQLLQKAIACAYHADADVEQARVTLGFLAGPEAATWCGGKFNPEFFYTLGRVRELREKLEKKA